MYALVYVDDILMTGLSTQLIHVLIDKLHEKFALKKFGIPRYLLGIEVLEHSRGTLLLTQTNYIRDLLTKVNMTEAKGVATPCLINAS